GQKARDVHAGPSYRPRATEASVTPVGNSLYPRRAGDALAADSKDGRSGLDLRALRMRPVDVEELAARGVGALEGVGAEVIALDLEEVGRQPSRAIAVEVGESAAKGRGRDAVARCQRDDRAPPVLTGVKRSGEVPVEHQVREGCIP